MAGALHGPDANVDQVVKDYFRSEHASTPNSISYEKTDLSFHRVKWLNTEPVNSNTYTGITRKVALENPTGSSGTMGVTLSKGTVSCRVHINGGRFVGKSKKVQLNLPPNKVFEGMDSIEIDANEASRDVVQKSTPIKMVNEGLANFKAASVHSQVNLFNSDFECTAMLRGKVTTDIGEVRVSQMEEFVIDHHCQDKQYSYLEGALVWTVKGFVEFSLDRRDHVTVQ